MNEPGVSLSAELEIAAALLDVQSELRNHLGLARQLEPGMHRLAGLQRADALGRACGVSERRWRAQTYR